MAKNKRKRQGGRGREFNALADDLNRAGQVADSTLGLGPLEEIDNTRSNETSNLLNQFSSLSDPSSASYAGRRSPELQDYVARLKSGLQGYDSYELNALRENRKNEIERGFSGGRAALARGQANAGTGATSKGAQLMALAKSYGQSGADAENDLFIKGADEKQKRLENYGSEITGLDSDERTRGETALANYRDYLNSTQNTELDKAKFNIGQGEKSRSLRTAGITGTLGVIEARRNARQQRKLIRQGYKSNENIARSSNSGGGGSQYEELMRLAESFGNGGQAA